MGNFWRKSLWFSSGMFNYTNNGFLRHQNSNSWPDRDFLNNLNLSEFSYLITGANSGIGFSAACSLAKTGATVHLLCRNVERGNQALEQIKVLAPAPEKIKLHIVDMSSLDEIKEFVQSLKNDNTKLNCLINNAGVMLNQRVETRDGIEKTFATNTLGVFLLTNLLIPILHDTATVCNRPSRVIVVTSGGALTEKLKLNDINYQNKEWDGTTQYAITKRHEICLTEYWAAKSQSHNWYINFYTMHPGWVDTPGVLSSMPDFYRYMKSYLRTLEQGADTIVWLAGSSNPELNLHNGGLFFDRKLEEKHIVWGNTSYSMDEISQLFNICCGMSGFDESQLNVIRQPHPSA